jgi:hypothetical protein
MSRNLVFQNFDLITLKMIQCNNSLTLWSKLFLQRLNQSAKQKISGHLRKPKVHYRVHKIPPLDSVLSYMNINICDARAFVPGTQCLFLAERQHSYFS